MRKNIKSEIIYKIQKRKQNRNAYKEIIYRHRKSHKIVTYKIVRQQFNAIL